jgi:hypothetical protein
MTETIHAQYYNYSSGEYLGHKAVFLEVFSDELKRKPLYTQVLERSVLMGKDEVLACLEDIFSHPHPAAK